MVTQVKGSVIEQSQVFVDDDGTNQGTNICHLPEINSVASDLHNCAILSGGYSGRENTIGSGVGTGAHFSAILAGYDQDVAPDSGDNCIARCRSTESALTSSLIG